LCLFSIGMHIFFEFENFATWMLSCNQLAILRICVRLIQK
jgi:hypothetical protein